MESTTVLTNLNPIEQKSIRPDTYQNEYREFIDLAVHELDAPLRKLSMLIELLTDKFRNISLDSDIQSYTERIESTVKNMRITIDDLSQLSKIIVEKEKKISCDLQSLVQNVIEEFQPLISEKNILINISALPIVEGNPEQLRQLFKNLVENAIKFARKDVRPLIGIRSMQLNQEEVIGFGLPVHYQYYKIEVSDNGIGFNPDYAEKIFRPFHRLHGRSKYPGTGIGLAICKKIMERHKGIIYAKGRENSGACFVIIIAQTANS